LYQNQFAPTTHRPTQQFNRNPLEDMSKALGLDETQKAGLKGIFDQSREKYRDLSRQFRPQYEEIRNQTNEEIRKLLNDSQKPRFEEFLRSMPDERMRRLPLMRGSRPGPGLDSSKGDYGPRQREGRDSQGPAPQ
jgi:hypothetical protein